MKKLVSAAAVATAMLAAAPMQAATVDFDVDLAGDNYDAIVAPYAGFTWDNWAFIDGDVYGNSGYKNGVISQNNVGCGCAGDWDEDYSTISSASQFTFTSGYFTSAWNDGATLLVEGLLDGSVVYSTTAVLDTSGASLLSFGWSGINSLRFSISGGTQNPDFTGAGDYFGADNLVFDAGAVPEPASWAMMIGGFALAGATMRRRKTALRFA